MKKLIVIRHGKSIGNADGVIQGSEATDQGLTREGREQIEVVTMKHETVLKGAKRIVLSNYPRAIQTAKIIFDSISKKDMPIIINDNVKEIDAGMLSGLSKKDAQMLYPEYYEIWSKRKDLDKIPGGEPGESIQARSIGFLMEYYGKEDFCDIVVTHAGFIRCLLNTIYNRERTRNFNIENGSIFVVEDVFKRLHMESRDRAMNSKVYIVETANGKYVVKIKKGQAKDSDYAEQDLLQSIGLNKIPAILSMQNYRDNRYCKVIRHLSGEHVYGKLNDRQFQALIKSEEKLSKELECHEDYRFRTKDLKQMILNISNSTQNEYVRDLAQNLLSSRYCTLLDDKEGYVLSHNDLNRDNILFDTNKEGEITANILDFESLEYAPKDYQFASMLASGLLLEGESMEKIMNTIDRKGVEKDKILYFMQIRVLCGLYFFTDKREKNTGNNEAAKDLLKRYFCASEIIKSANKVQQINVEER